MRRKGPLKLNNKFPISCKCGKYHNKVNQGRLCKRCQTKVTFKMEHKK